MRSYDPAMGQTDAAICTERLRLRRPTDADMPALIAISTDPGTNEHRPGGAPSPTESEEIVRGFGRDWEQHGIGYWVVEYLGQVIGVAGVRPVRLGEADCWNLYYRFSPAWWGRGLAAEAAREAVVVARAHTPTRPIVARTRADNSAAVKLAEAIGMTRRIEFDGDGFIAFAF